MGFFKILAKQLQGSKLVFNILFHGLHVGLFIYGWKKQQNDPRLAGLNTLKFSVWISRGAGLVLSLDGAIILLPMCRNILRYIRPKLKLIPLDESQWFHRQVAYSMLFWTPFHVIAHYTNFFNVEKTQIRKVTALQIHYKQVGGITGHVMLVCMLLMYTTAHHKIRQQSFEAFWYTHHLFIPFLLGLYTHASGCFVRDTPDSFSPFDHDNFWQHCIGYEGWRWELWGGGLYLVDRIYREIRSRRDTKVVRIVRHPYDSIEIQFKKPSMKYKAGQWLFLNVPCVSRYQWHPFTITSCPFDNYISVHVRQVGDFTRSLAEAFGAGKEQLKMYEDLDPNSLYDIALEHGKIMPEIRIDGPYGAPAEDVFDYEIAVLIGTGIGVTPWASILKNIWHMRKNTDPPIGLRRVEFIWVCKDTTSFAWFQALLSSLEAQSDEACRASGKGDEFLRIHPYLTQKLDDDTSHNIYLHSVGASVDPLTELKSRMNFGRPNFSKMFKQMSDDISNGTYLKGYRPNVKMRVGVYYCGANAAVPGIKKACREATTSDVKFSFWKEHF
ncbi:Superoxide-generating NADPH oxidase heavy chain subunit A [Erysiphe necator]|uniref:Putative cytochrome b-245 heavy chain subunit beta n=1 Tax=Uncinula necator TaxID=52586 RepID=A0A0B1PF98_UNCNE|nr:Superoxide-generating NADPH oxidase heavy chain subunit A [Erysiphe necator]KHJ35990.1 putative cytochrome b-245 heavy chain subunit beta [Erysiphe necator]